RGGAGPRLRAADHRLYRHVAVLRLRRAHPVLALVALAPRLPAGRLRAAPAAVPRNPPHARPARPQPDRRADRAADRRADRRQRHPRVTTGTAWARAGFVLAAVLAADQVTKVLVRNALAVGERREVLGPLGVGRVTHDGLDFWFLG